MGTDCQGNCFSYLLYIGMCLVSNSLYYFDDDDDDDDDLTF